ncbi:MAG: DNA-directed RNA polymerase subunit H [Candidatus Aenigmatarchaeota archaeon]
MTDQKIDVLKHELVPKHRILTEEEKEALLKKYGVKLTQLPRISSKDPVVKAIGAKPNDVLEITRKSVTAGETKYYRVVTPNK